ncbi:hypothetical protein TorRG33x02_149520, partial [Trema orientale]
MSIQAQPVQPGSPQPMMMPRDPPPRAIAQPKCNEKPRPIAAENQHFAVVQCQPPTLASKLILPQAGIYTSQPRINSVFTL